MAPVFGGITVIIYIDIIRYGSIKYAVLRAGGAVSSTSDEERYMIIISAGIAGAILVIVGGDVVLDNSSPVGGLIIGINMGGAVVMMCVERLVVSMDLLVVENNGEVVSC